MPPSLQTARLAGPVLTLSLLAVCSCVAAPAHPPQSQTPIAVDATTTHTVSGYPPEALYEEMTPSPGFAFVWIDGSWHWNGYDWVWSRGRWVQRRRGYVYVAPHYNRTNGRYIYRAGYWSRRDRVPPGARLRDHRDGRPATYVTPDNRRRLEEASGASNAKAVRKLR